VCTRAQHHQSYTLDLQMEADADRILLMHVDPSTVANLIPSVSIAILNYQLREALRRCLEAARSQRYPLEILVVDNASADGSPDMVRDEFPDVRLVRLPQNIATAARNIGVASAKGDIVFTIDNDVLFTTP